ncbi:hypothetical protein OAU13_00880 [bacterium]|nr:hypothetical protein [bacterium]
MSSVPPGYVVVRPKMISTAKVVGMGEITKPNGVKKKGKIMSVDVGYFDLENNLIYQYAIHINIPGKVW